MIDARLALAEVVIREAGDLAATYYAGRETLVHEAKGAHDFVSIADRRVEALIRERLAAAFADDGFLGEESGGNGGDRCWVVDPIDGTHNFLLGIPVWGVSIAYVVGGEPVIGLVYLPCDGRLYTAVRGRGAWCNGQPLRVSQTIALSDATIAVGVSRRGDANLPLRLLDRALREGSAVRCLGACVAGLTLVAEGAIDAYYKAHLNAWDCLAGILIVREAGGRINHVLGMVMLAQGGPVLASAPALFDKLAPMASLETGAAPSM